MGRRARNGNSAAISTESIVRDGSQRLRRATLSLLLILATTLRAAAQTPTGDIQGAVREQLGGPLAGATITVTQVESGSTRRTRTSAEGRFSVTGLPPGTYEVLADFDGLASERQERIRLGIGQTVVSLLELRPAATPDTLTLAPAPSVLEPRHADVRARLEPVEIDHLPLPDRRALNLVAITPAVTRGPGGVEASAGVPATYGTLGVDGLDLWPVSSGPAPALPPAERPYLFSRTTIQDAAVVVSAPTAEYGRSAGASLSVVTRAGADVFAAEAFEQFRDAALAANTQVDAALGRPAPDLRANQFGGSIGGPLAPGHTFFASYDGLRARHENTVHLNTATPADPAGIVASHLAPLASSWTRTRHQDLLFVRTDHRLGEPGRLSVRYHQLNLDGGGLDGGGTYRTRDTAGPATVDVHAGAATFARTLDASAVNELRALVVRAGRTAGAFGTTPQAYIRDRGAIALQTGRSAEAPFDSRLDRFQIADTLMWAGTSHTVKLGAEATIERWRYASSALAHGSYLFRSPESFVTGVPNGLGESFSQTFFGGGGGTAVVEPDTRDAAVFVQDTWLLGDTLTAHLGLRYQVQHAAAPRTTNPHPELRAAGIDTGLLRTDANNWGPRLGLAWAPSSRHVARAAYGLMHGPISTSMLASAHAYNGIDVRMASFAGAQGDPVPTYPGRFAEMPVAARPGVVFFDDTFQRARFQHLSAAYEWEWVPTTSIGASYFHVRGDHLPRAVDINVGEPSPALFTIEDRAVAVDRFGPGPFPSFGRVVRYESAAESRYNGGAFELRRRAAQGWQYRVTYTLGTVTDTAPAVTPVFPEGPGTSGTFPRGSDATTSFAAADHDIRHQLVLSSVWLSDILADRYDGFIEMLLRRWRVGLLYTAASGLPYSALVDADIDGDRNRWHDLAPETTRNAFRRPPAVQVDMRIAREFSVRDRVSITGHGDIFNVLNAAHHRGVDSTQYSVSGSALLRNPQFGEGLDRMMPRTMQLGVTVRF